MTDTPHIPRRQAITRIGLAAAAFTLPPDTRARLTSTLPPVNAEEFERLLRLASVPSMNVAIVDGDRITTSAYGVKQTGSTERATERAVYAAASLTKTVFAYVFLGLADEGVVSLDKPVSEYIELPHPTDPRGAKITARHLLSHSSGWRNWRNNITPPLTADFEPGSRWLYSGEGFFHMQRIAEKLTGKSVGQLARERVFDPLGMKSSSIVALAEFEPNQVPGHTGRGDPSNVFGRPALLELRRMMAARGVSLEAAKVEDAEQALRTADASVTVLPSNLNPNAAASMLTTAGDFALLLRHIVTARRAGGKAARIVELMYTPHVRCNDAVQWGLGVGLSDTGGNRYAWQWGDNPGFKNIYFADAKNEKAIAVFTNGDRGARVYERVIRSLTGIDHPAFLWS